MEIKNIDMNKVKYCEDGSVVVGDEGSLIGIDGDALLKILTSKGK